MRALFDRVKLPSARFVAQICRRRSFNWSLAPRSDFTESRARRRKLSGPNLRGAVFHRARLDVLTFDWQTLMRQFLVDADLEGSKIGGAEMAARNWTELTAGTGIFMDDLKKSLNRHKIFEKNA